MHGERMKENYIGEFNFLPFKKVIFGPGTVTRLKAELEELGATRVVVITTHSLIKTALYDRIKNILGDLYVGSYEGTIQHVPRRCVLEGARMCRQLKADSLVAFGGGSCIDTAKGIALVIAEGEELDRLRVRFVPPNKLEVPTLKKQKIPIVTISTTLSGAEFTNIIGITDEARRSKDLYIDNGVTPKVIFLDPEMTTATPPILWASTGMKTFSDAIEMVCSPNHQPFTATLCLEAIKIFYHDLPRSVKEPLNLNVREKLQFAMWMTFSGFTNVLVGAVAALRHQIGALFNIPHGIASTIVLPHVIEFNLSVIMARLSLIANAMGITTYTVKKAIQNLIKELGLPQRLREVSVKESDLELIAKYALEDFIILGNPKPITNIDQLLQILRNAF
jgi:alcohol dehydrogenase